MVVIVLCISLPFCYVIVHRNICRNPSFSVAKSLCHRCRQLVTLFSLYISDSIVSFILNRIVSINPKTTPTTTIQQFPSLTNWIVDLSDRPLPCVNNYHITLNIWIKLYQLIQWQHQQQQQQQLDKPVIDQWDYWCIRSSSSFCQ